jgi:hypothetical protein
MQKINYKEIKNKTIKSFDKSFTMQLTDNYSEVYISSAGGNCKLCHISDFAYSICKHNYKMTLTNLKELFKYYHKLCFEVNVTTLEEIERINEFFPLLFCNKVPIGYDSSGGYTYFALFLTNNNFQSGQITNEVIKNRLITKRKEFENFKYDCKFLEQEEKQKEVLIN